MIRQLRAVLYDGAGAWLIFSDGSREELTGSGLTRNGCAHSTARPRP